MIVIRRLLSGFHEFFLSIVYGPARNPIYRLLEKIHDSWMTFRGNLSGGKVKRKGQEAHEKKNYFREMSGMEIASQLQLQFNGEIQCAPLFMTHDSEACLNFR